MENKKVAVTLKGMTSKEFEENNGITKFNSALKGIIRASGIKGIKTAI